MSETPRVDAQRHDLTEHDGLQPHSDGDWVPVEFAKTLEAALRGIQPFVMDDYMPDFATPEFNSAVEAMNKALEVER